MTAAVSSSPLLSSTSSVAGSAAGTSSDQIKGIAKQFEAIFLRQMLSAARATKFGDSLFTDSQAMDTFKQMQDERFADIASDTGAFGLGKMIEAHLARFVQVDAGTQASTDGAAQQESTGNGI